MYLVRIEPVYSQGVGYFELVTNNIKNVKKFRKELYKYANYVYEFNPSDIDSWEFYEYIFKLNNYIPEENDKEFNGYLAYNKDYCGRIKNMETVTKIKLEKQIQKNYDLEEFEYDKQILIDHVYNYFDINIKPIHIENFDIIGENYLK
jgi:hypothetical protein